jgi:nucleotide-binding universal stress UspA family protein
MSAELNAEIFEVKVMAKTVEKTDEEVLAGKIVLESKMVRLTNILVGMDFSAASERALEYALALARRYEARVYLAHVITSDANVMLAPELMASGHEREERDAQEKMGEILISGRLREVAHETVIEHGSLWPTIEALIGKHQIDLVVVGTERVGGLQKMLLGSGAEQIFRQAMCPVLTVGPAATGGAPKEIEFKNILFATDFGLGAEREAAYAFSFAQEHQANLTLLHVVTHADDYSEAGLALKRDAISRELAELAPIGGEVWCKPEFRMRLGEPVEEILAVAREMKADLIVIGAKRGKGLAAGHRPNTTAYKVVCGAPCPVLTVRS